MNCPGDKMHLLMEHLKGRKLVLDDKPKKVSSKENEKSSSNTLQKLKENLDTLVDPLFGKEEPPSLADDGEFHLDPLYSVNKSSHHLSKYPNYVPHLNKEELHKPDKWSTISTTVSFVMGALDKENNTWTTNDVLNKATIGLKKLIEASPKGIPLHVLESLPTETLANIGGGENVTDSSATALERILRHGCDRERFFEDSNYRQDSLCGLIM